MIPTHTNTLGVEMTAVLPVSGSPTSVTFRAQTQGLRVKVRRSKHHCLQMPSSKLKLVVNDFFALYQNVLLKAIFISIWIES